MPCIITPTMNIRIGTVTAGAAAAVEVVNEGTPNNADWVINMTLPAVGDNSVNTQQIVDGAITAAKIAAGAITGAQIAAGAITGNNIAANSVPISALSNLPISAQKQLYAHYCYVNSKNGRGVFLVYFVNTVSTGCTSISDIFNQITERCVTCGSFCTSDKQYIMCSIFKSAETNNITFVAFSLSELASTNLDFSDIEENITSVTDTPIPLGLNAGNI